jgi:hypothetical protein
MPYDMETDNEVVRLIDTNAITADHIYINDVDMANLENTVKQLSSDVTAMSKRLTAVETKIDLIYQYVKWLHENQEI